MTSTEITLKRKLSDAVCEYTSKVADVDNTISAYEQAVSDLNMNACVCGTYGRVNIDTGYIHKSTILESLLKSAWYNIYDHLEIKNIAPAEDKRKFDQDMARPPEFTIENIRATFEDYILDRRGNILRGLAEVFCSLDDFYKSHDRVKIGVKGLPKRIILSNVGSYGSWGRDRLKNVLDALATYQGKPLTDHHEIDKLIKDGDLLSAHTTTNFKGKVVEYDPRGVKLKTFANGNGHLYFEPQELRDINMGLAEYYGDILADCHEDKPDEKQESTAVSKDLQYYPTPVKVVNSIVENLYSLKYQKVLEPSCGCGRFMDALRERGAVVSGYEIDVSKADICIHAGHNVLVRNFLETVPTPEFDRVVMNPPFFGKHYYKHILHAMKFLKSGGILTAILPVTARYDHGLIKDGTWRDLPVGSFRESGTNINTTVLTIKKK